MSRLFNGTDEYLKASSCPISGAPFTIVGMFRCNDLPNRACIISLSDDGDGGAQGQYAVTITHDGQTAATGDDISATARVGGGSASFVSPEPISSQVIAQNTWYKFVAVFASTTDRRMYIDGGNEGSSTTSISEASFNACDIGRLGDSTPNFHFPGDIAEIAIYDFGFTAAQAAEYGTDHAMTPLQYRPANLLMYLPLFGRSSPEQDLIGGVDYAVTNTPDASAHPVSIRPAGLMLVFPAPAGGGSTTLVVADATQAVAVDALALTQAQALSVADTAQAVTADNLALTQAHVLAIADALHAVTSDNITLGSSAQLVVADTLQAVTADALALTQAHVLAVADTLQAVAADALALTQANVLAVSDTVQAITSDNVTLSDSIGLVVADALLAVDVDTVALTQASVLAIADAVLAVTAAGIDLAQASTLVVDDALLALLADNITLGEPPTTKPTVIIVKHRNRRILVAGRNRLIKTLN